MTKFVSFWESIIPLAQVWPDLEKISRNFACVFNGSIIIKHFRYWRSSEGLFGMVHTLNVANVTYLPSPCSPRFVFITLHPMLTLVLAHTSSTLSKAKLASPNKWSDQNMRPMFSHIFRKDSLLLKKGMVWRVISWSNTWNAKFVCFHLIFVSIAPSIKR